LLNEWNLDFDMWWLNLLSLVLSFANRANIGLGYIGLGDRLAGYYWLAQVFYELDCYALD